MLKPHETLLGGRWHESQDGIVADGVSTRIDSLIREHLDKVANSASGWESLCRDPDDQRLWDCRFRNQTGTVVVRLNCDVCRLPKHVRGTERSSTAPRRLVLAEVSVRYKQTW
jgi:hypothetical protein